MTSITDKHVHSFMHLINFSNNYALISFFLPQIFYCIVTKSDVKFNMHGYGLVYFYIKKIIDQLIFAEFA